MGQRLAEVIAAPPYGYSEVSAALPSGAISVESPAELCALLQRIADSCPRPLIACVIRSDGDQLCIGLGRPVSHLNYIPADNDPPYYEVVGAESDGEVCFDYAGEPTYYATRNTVPLAVALKVASEFAQAKGLPLPALVEWERL